MLTWKEDMRGITVGELACPAALHPNCVVVSTCQVKGRVIGSDEHSLLYGPKEILGLPVHDGEFVQLDGMTYGGLAWS